MKFANLYWFDACMKETGIIINIGDTLQFLIVDYLYELMGIPKKDIVYLSTNELKTYHGEQVVLPLNWGILQPEYMEGNKISISSSITPVFLAMTLGGQYHKSYINAENIAYLKKYEPVGCRDQLTMDFLINLGIKAYLNGCMTAILPRRKKVDSQKKVFLIDIPESLKEYLPKSKWDNVEILHHQQNYDIKTDKFQIIENIKMQYQKYAKEAGLIVTSRLHAASPCMAMGIPVIFAKNVIDSRFGWIDKYLPLYDAGRFNEINWQPKTIEFELLKQDIIKLAVRRIESTYNKKEQQINTYNFWNMDHREKYKNFYDVINNEYEKAKFFLEKRYTASSSFTYGLWGIKETALNFHQYMRRNYPNAKLNLMVDRFKNVELDGVTITHPDQTDTHNTDVIFVFAIGAVQDAFAVLCRQNFEVTNCCIVCDNFVASL